MWESIKAFVDQLIEHPSVLFILLGAILFILGISGGIVYHDWLPITDIVARLSAVGVGLVLLAIGMILAVRSSSPEPNGEAYGVKITSPHEDEYVDIVDVKGEIKKRPPNGYTLNDLTHLPRFGRCILSSETSALFGKRQ